MQCDFTDTMCEPQFSEWGRLAEANRETLREITSSIGTVTLKSVRSAVIEESLTFTSEMIKLAVSEGLEAERLIPAQHLKRWQLAGENGIEESTVYVSGHQPVIYHSGIVYKTRLLAKAGAQPGSIAINVAVDSDEEDAGMFYYPVSSGSSAGVDSETVAAGGGVIASQKIRSKDEIAEAIKRIASSDAEGKHSARTAKLLAALELYKKFAGQNAAVANSIVRRIIDGHNSYLEVPITRLMHRPEVQSALLALLGDPREWVRQFNDKLAGFRSANRIRNPADPFPPLAVQPSEVELPFWVLNGGVREPLYYGGSLQEDIWGAADGKVVPRAILITSFLRLFAGDLFIHGTGGQKYDAFTDYFLVNAMKIKPPVFAVATASRRLFEEERRRYEEEKASRQRFRNLLYHPEKFIAPGD
ncbi:MAG: hypothetical protein J5J00_01860, partial [Deltaproteobacteria bacterium]|nr:hypothetical protein [Deltaproteobacteria bacterium]